MVGQTLAGKITREIFTSAQQQLGWSPEDKPKQTEGSGRAPLLSSKQGESEPQTTSKGIAYLGRCLPGWGAPKRELQAPSPGQVTLLQTPPKRRLRGLQALNHMSCHVPNNPLLPSSKPSLPGKRENSSQAVRKRTQKCGRDLSLDASGVYNSGHKGSKAQRFAPSQSVFLIHQELTSWWKSCP